MQTNNMLDTLYGMFQEHFDYRIDESEIKRTKGQLEKQLKQVNMKYEDIEYSVLDYGIAYEKAGFRNGFQIAARIFAECLNTRGRATEDIPENPFGA